MLTESARRLRLTTSGRFLLRSMSVRGPSFLLALLAITVGASVTATMLTIQADLGAKMSRELRRYGPNLLLTASDEAREGETAPSLDEKGVRGLPDALRRAGLISTSVSPLLIAAGTVTRTPAGGQSASRAGAPTQGEALDRAAATVVGADFEALRRLSSSWRVAGTWPGSSEAGCLVGTSLAARLHLRVGRTASIRLGTPFGCHVTGIVSTGEGEDEEILVPLRLLQEASGLSGRVSLAALSIDGGTDAVTRAGRVAESALPGSRALPLRQIAAAQGAILGKLQRMMVLLTIVVLLLTALCLVTTLMAIVVEREGEIGLMRSIGAGDGEIIMMFLGELGLLGLVGSLAGFVLGAAGARVIGSRLFDAAIDPRGAVLPIVLAISLGLCLISVLLPLKRALSVQPAAALRGD